MYIYRIFCIFSTVMSYKLFLYKYTSFYKPHFIGSRIFFHAKIPFRYKVIGCYSSYLRKHHVNYKKVFVRLIEKKVTCRTWPVVCAVFGHCHPNLGRANIRAVARGPSVGRRAFSSALTSQPRCHWKRMGVRTAAFAPGF